MERTVQELEHLIEKQGLKIVKLKAKAHPRQEVLEEVEKLKELMKQLPDNHPGKNAA